MISSFTALNVTQFLSALNDNIYKLLLVFLLINIKGAAQSNTILALAGGIFVIPFLLFASLAGTLADRYSKRAIITITRLSEIVTLSFGVLAIALQSAIGGYIVLFLMATQSTLFSPAKFGIIPEIVPREKISHYNGLLTSTTYLAIIIGTFLASFLTDLTGKNFLLASLVCLFVALLGALFSLGIEKTAPQAKEKRVSVRFISEIYRTLKRSQKTRYLFVSIVFGAYFLFMGAYVQLNIIPFAMQSLHQSEVHGGYLFLMTAIGIGIGSYFAGRFSGKEIELGFVPLSAFGLAATLFALHLFAAHFYIIVFVLVLLGMLGGFYIVPIDSFIQMASPPEDRGQNVAAANFLSFVGVIIASGLIALLGSLWHLSAAVGFLVVGLITFIVAIVLTLVMADQVLRLLVAKIAYLFWNLTVTGKTKEAFSAPFLILAPRQSWLDTLIVMATLPRHIRYIVPLTGRFAFIRLRLYRLLALIPLDIKHFTPLTPSILHEIKSEIEKGHPVCLMQPIPHSAKILEEWTLKLALLLKQTHVPLIPIHIAKAPLPTNTPKAKALLSLFRTPIHVRYGNPLN